MLPPAPGWFGHEGTLHETVFNTDVSWLHRWDSGVGFELGIRVGVVAGDDTDGTSVVLPDLAMITGVRF